MPEFTHIQITTGNDLSSLYNSIQDILDDPDLEACAYAADMRKEDLVNILIKHKSIEKGVMSQRVSVPIVMSNQTVEQVDLVKTGTQEALTYGDFLTDRSGPKFGGYLDDTVGHQYLSDNASKPDLHRLNMLEERFAETLSKFPDVKDANKVKVAAQMLKRPFKTQRKLSDFDLTAVSLRELERSLEKVINEKLSQLADANGDPLYIPHSLLHEVTLALWQEGGAIDISIIEKCINEPNGTYTQTVRSKLEQSGFNHVLLDGPGKHIFKEGVGLPNLLNRSTAAEADTTYGLGIAFMGTEVRSDPSNPSNLLLTSEIIQKYKQQNPPFNHEDPSVNQALLQSYFPREPIGELLKHDGLFELGDIICDSKSHYEDTFTHDKNIDNALREIKANFPETDRILKSMQIKPNQRPSYFEFDNMLDMLRSKARTLSEKKAINNAQSKLIDGKMFVDSMGLFEECAKKEAQSQIFKLEAKAQKKLIGNISDIEPFMSGAVALSERSVVAKAHLQLMELSLMINATRWGIDSDTLATLGEGETVPGEAFMRSINERSYSYSESQPGLREQIGWSNISIEEAQARLDSFQNSMSTVWDHIKERTGFFMATDNLKAKEVEFQQALQEKLNSPTPENCHRFIQASRQKKAAREVLYTSMLNTIKDDMPDLHAMMQGMNHDIGVKSEIILNLVAQAEESVVFGMRREARAKKQQAVTHDVAKAMGENKGAGPFQGKNLGQQNNQVLNQYARFKEHSKEPDKENNQDLKPKKPRLQ